MPISPTAVSAAPITPPRLASAEVAINADSSLSGHPTHLTESSANADIVARFDLDAPAGSQLRVDVPDGLKFNPWAWVNKGTTGVSFAKDGAGYVATAERPITQISLDGMHFNGQSANFSINEREARVGDVLPRLSVNGVAQAPTPEDITIQAPLGWSTAARDGSVDPLRNIGNHSETLVAHRDGAKGVETLATFTGAYDGRSVTGVRRAAREAVERTAQNAASAAYSMLAVSGLAP